MNGDDSSRFKHRQDDRFMNLIVIPDTKVSEDDIFSDWLQERSIHCGSDLINNIFNTAARCNRDTLYVDNGLFKDGPPPTAEFGVRPNEGFTARTENAEYFRKKIENWYLHRSSSHEKAKNLPGLKKHASSLGKKILLSTASACTKSEMVCPLCSTVLATNYFEEHVESCMQDIGSDFSDCDSPALGGVGSRNQSFDDKDSFISVSTNGSTEQLCPEDNAPNLKSSLYTGEYDSSSAKILQLDCNAAAGRANPHLSEIGLSRPRTAVNTSSPAAPAKVAALDREEDSCIATTTLIKSTKKVISSDTTSSSHQSQKSSSEIIIDYDEEDTDCNGYINNAVAPLDIRSDISCYGDYDDENREFVRKELASLSPLQDFINIKELHDSLKPRVPDHLKMYFNQFPGVSGDKAADYLHGMIETLTRKSTGPPAAKKRFRTGWRRFGPYNSTRSRGANRFSKK